MQLSRALRIKTGDVVAIVGAGGKTSAIRRLVVEFADQMPVLVTTSTKLAAAEGDLTDEHAIIEDAGNLITVLSEWKPEKSLLLTAPRFQDEPKWDGLPLAQLQDVIEFSREKRVVLLIEADGAAGRSLKVPAAHEPALPHNLDLMVPVVGIDVLGALPGSDLVHRPELLQELLKIDADVELNIQHIASLLKHPAGGMKSLPVHAELRVLINKVSTKRELDQARKVAHLTLAEKRVESVIIGAVQQDDPVTEARSRIAAVVLAAGESQRFQGNKLLHLWKGKPILEHVLDAVRESKVDRRILVVGHDQEAILEGVKHEGFELVHNQAWEEGQSGSVRQGLEAVRDEVEAVLFPLGDMPMITGSLIDELIDRHAITLAPIVAPRVGGEWGNPVLFDRTTFTAFSELKADRGAKTLFSDFLVEAVAAGESAQRDIDQLDDLSGLDRE